MCVCVCVCVCVVSVIVKRPVLTPSLVDRRSRNPLYYYYYSPGHCEVLVLRASHAHVTCLIINYFFTVTIMYYSSLQVKYMITVFI